MGFTTLAIAGLSAGPVAARPYAGLRPGLPGDRLAADTGSGPSARDVAQSRERVQEESAHVGRIGAALAQANGRLDDLSAQAELAVERYNGERARLTEAGTAYEAATQRTAEARRRFAEVRDDVAALAASAYRSGGGLLSGAAVLGGPGGPAGFLERATTMQVLANRRRALLQRETAAKTVADVFERQAHDALAARQAATSGAAVAQQAAVAAVTRQQEAVGRIQQQKTALIAELNAARTHAATLEQARAAALERARAARLGNERTVSHQVVLAGIRLGAGDRTLARSLARDSDLGSVAASAALKWLGTPYSWGGGNESGPTRGIAQGAGTVGFDCSGLVTYAWGRAGVRLIHYATSQYNAGPHPAKNELRPGDLVFFAHDPADPGTIHHVGIYIGNGQMVEAPFTGARVRISPAFRPDYAGATRPAASQ
ncbi:NlpC/P60 family protein [Actinoallomurus vinaceus]